MEGTLNAHKVFKGTSSRPGYVVALNISGDCGHALRNARDEIRRTLREGMLQWQNLAKAQDLVEHRNIDQASQLPPLRPRFRMQGSGVYHTLNDPAYKPPQEVDYDDGLFLPTSFINGGGSVRPLLAAKGYFKMVEAILAPLCAREGWDLVTTKPTCVRVRIDQDAHIDLPLYAIPDEEFVELAEAAARAMLAKGVASADIELAERVYMVLPEDRIMLAHRDRGWIESDPREIENWFLGAIKEHGEVLRRVCRYLKGWRDYQWLKGGPSSITLMACVVTVFDDLNGVLPKNRDDLALQAVADRLEELFSQPIPNPVLPDSDWDLDKSWSPQERLSFKSRAAELRSMMDGILNHCYHSQIAFAQLQEKFGDRIPNDELLIEIDSKEREVLAYEPAKVAAPFVPRTTSG